MRIYTRNPAGKRYMRFNGKPEVVSFSAILLNEGNEKKFRYGVNAMVTGDDGREYHVWMDRHTLDELNKVAQRIEDETNAVLAGEW